MKRMKSINPIRQHKKGILQKAAALLVSLTAVCAAAGTALAATNQPVSGSPNIPVDKYLVFKAQANVPNTQFSFTIASGTEVAADATAHTPKINPGPAGAKLSFASDKDDTAVAVQFSPENSKFTTVQGTDSVQIESGQAYAKQTFFVDLSAVSFVTPGVYRWVITEAEHPDPAFTNDTNPVRYLDVYVFSDDTGTLSVGGFVLHPDASVLPLGGGGYAGKDKGFVNRYTTHDLTLKKTVTGNLADREQYFAFTVTITDAVPGTRYAVDLTNAEKAPDGQENPAQLTADETGSVTGVFYLKHGQQVQICGLTGVTAYAISEEAGDYVAGYSVDGGNPVSGRTTPKATMANGDHLVVFTNDLAGTPATGIQSDHVPDLIVGLVGAGALILLVALLIRKKRRGDGHETK